MKNRREINHILELLKHSGKIALKYYDAPDIELKNDKSVVTQAGREIESFLASEFDRPQCDRYMIGEYCDPLRRVS